MQQADDTRSQATDTRSEASASASSSSQSLADALLTPLQTFEWPAAESAEIVKHYNTESLTSAKQQSRQFDIIVHRWVADIANQRGIFFLYVNRWTDQLFRRHPVSSYITQLRMRRTLYSTSYIAYIILIVANILKLVAGIGSILFFFAHHSPSLLPEILRPAPIEPPATWSYFFYKYSIGIIVGGALNAAQATVDIGYSIAIACLLWVISSYASISLHNYSSVIQRRHSLAKIEQQFLTDFHKSIQQQLIFYLKPIVIDSYRAFFAFPISERAQLLGTYTRQDSSLQTVHYLLLNECESIAYSAFIEAECTKLIKDDILRQMVQLETQDYIECYTQFKRVLDDAGRSQMTQLQAVGAAAGTAASKVSVAAATAAVAAAGAATAATAATAASVVSSIIARARASQAK
jgi:hypothetical protein